MTAPRLYRTNGGSGYFRIWVKHPGGRETEVTFVRGVPTVVDSYSSADPFGDSSAVLSFASITGFDKPGTGDLWWLVPYAKVSIFWYETGSPDITSTEPKDVSAQWVGIKNTRWIWEGYIASEEIGQPYQVQCKGALFQADNFLAAPFFPSYPVPYETMIGRLLDPRTHPTIGTKGLQIEWPASWNVTVPTFKEPSYLWFLKPFGVATGAKWSGLTTRDTGSWQPVLTGYIQNLLATMYTDDGDQWTLMKKVGRVPVLRVRQKVTYVTGATLVVYYEAPGLKASLSRDFSQTANVIYGAGKDLNGAEFSGMQVSGLDGETTWYQPYAALPQVYPTGSTNPRYLTTIPVKETRLQFAQGMNEISAKDTAATQLMRFADPGYTGTISMQSDPMQDGKPFNKFLIQAGMSILLKNFRGTDVLMHITAVTCSPEDNTVSLTVDTKYRDALTVAEVRARTRDALDPVNLLKPGSVSAVVQDMVKRWNYTEGSGVIPSGGTVDATPFFKSMPTSIVFPWTDWTKKYPPSKYPQYYIKVSRKSSSANDRWQDYGYSTKQASTKRSLGVPIKGAQSANIRLVQMAAYDKNGNPITIRFHVSLYLNSGVSSTQMPTIPANSKGLPYPAAQHYPFFPQAFNSVKPSGENESNAGVMLPEGTDFVMGWGTYDEPAGYSPGSKGTGGAKTGMLVDEEAWSFDTSQADTSFDMADAAKTAKSKTAGRLYAMVFQDDVQEAYFLGRMFKVPDGAGG